VGDLPFVQARIDAGEPEWFFVDTGSPVAILSERIRGRLTVHDTGTTVHVGGATAGSLATHVVTVSEIQLGTTSLDDLSAIVLDLSSLERTMGFPIGGTIGMNAFEHRVVTLDYPHAQLVFGHAALSPTDPDVVPMIRRDDHPAIVVKVAGIDLLAEVDSGSEPALQISDAAAQRLGFRGPFVEVARGQGVTGTDLILAARLDGDLVVARQTIDAPILETSKDDMVEPDAARLGAGLLARFTVTLDAESSLIRLARREAEPIRVESIHELGVAFVHEPAGWQVAPGGGASGFEPGDVVVSVDDRPADGFDAGDWARLARGGKPIRVRVRRGAEIPITPTVLVR
jgi:hypothetical protein